MAVGVYMLVAALLLDVFSVVAGRWTNFVAAFLALGGFLRLIAPSKFGHQVREWVDQGASELAHAVSEYDPRWGDLLKQVGLGAIATVVTALYIKRMWNSSFGARGKKPKKAKGEAADESSKSGKGSGEILTSAWIWAGSLVLALFWGAVPGRLGEGVRWALGFGADIAGRGTEWLTTLHHLTSTTGVI